jgi:hypothetical protein
MFKVVTATLAAVVSRRVSKARLVLQRDGERVADIERCMVPAHVPMRACVLARTGPQCDGPLEQAHHPSGRYIRSPGCCIHSSGRRAGESVG